MVKKSKKHAGLLLITENNKVAVLQASRSYNDIVNKNLKYNKHIPFVEKLSIPRGQHDAGETDYETAVREFIEETGLVFDKVFVYNDPFLLEWWDNSKMYKYIIYIAFLVGSLYCLKRRPNSYNIKLNKKERGGEYKVDMQKQRSHSRELVRRLEIMNLRKYITYMETRQLYTYKYSNYEAFFDYVQSVKRVFERGGDECFFVIDLFWYADSERYNLMWY